ncbi:protein of unknown function (plasmid) [Caballeronia sp. S22]
MFSPVTGSPNMHRQVFVISVARNPAVCQWVTRKPSFGRDCLQHDHMKLSPRTHLQM